MAGTRFAYVRSFELPDPLLPNTFIVVRIDGHGFHRFVCLQASISKMLAGSCGINHSLLSLQTALSLGCTLLCKPIRFSDAHAYIKPNDHRGLELMNAAAQSVMEAYPDVMLAFGESDEYRYELSSGSLSPVLSFPFILSSDSEFYHYL